MCAHQFVFANLRISATKDFSLMVRRAHEIGPKSCISGIITVSVSVFFYSFSSDEPGVVYVRKTLSDPESSHQLLKSIDRLPPAELPDQQIPPGLDANRKWYLFEKIREFCSVATRDITCPQPDVPKPWHCFVILNSVPHQDVMPRLNLMLQFKPLKT